MKSPFEYKQTSLETWLQLVLVLSSFITIVFFLIKFGSPDYGKAAEMCGVDKSTLMSSTPLRQQFDLEDTKVSVYKREDHVGEGKSLPVGIWGPVWPEVDSDEIVTWMKLNRMAIFYIKDGKVERIETGGT